MQGVCGISIKGHLAAAQPGPEDRRHPRRHLYLETSGGLPSSEKANVIVHNISVSGMLIETSLQLSSGVVIQIDLPPEDSVDAQVVWVSDSFVGCRFAAPISDAALSAIQLKSQAALPAMVGQETGRQRNGTTWGKWLEQTRKSRGLTLAQVADRLGVSKPTVWAWEKGKAKPVDERIPALAEVLGVSPEELLESGQQQGVSELIEASRKQIAQLLGIDHQAIRILIEL